MYAGAEITSLLGFNAAAIVGDALWGSHGDAGLVAWRLGETAAPFFTARPDRDGTGGPRNVIGIDDSRVLYSAGPALHAVQCDGTNAAVAVHGDSNIIAIFALRRDRVVVVRGDGRIDRVDPATLKLLGSEFRSGDICSVGTLPWMASRRLLLATVNGPVICIGPDDTVVTQYASAHRGLRAVAAAADLVAAVSSDRQRIILWRSADGRRPAGEIHVAALARHRAADICFA
jgi:hypothetical protein